MCRVGDGASYAHVAQLVEHVLGKDEVSGSIPLVGSRRAWGVGIGFLLETSDSDREEKQTVTEERNG